MYCLMMMICQPRPGVRNIVGRRSTLHPLPPLRSLVSAQDFLVTRLQSGHKGLQGKSMALRGHSPMHPLVQLVPCRAEGGTCLTMAKSLQQKHQVSLLHLTMKRG